MKLVRGLCFLFLASAMMLGQNTPTADSTSDTSVADQLKKLRESVAEQQKQMQQQQEQIQKLEEQLQQQQEAAAKPADSSSFHLTNASLTTSGAVSSSANAQPASYNAQETERKESPLSFRIGSAEFTPGGFADFENIFRTTNTGNVATTSFGAIPFSNNEAGHLTEFRETGEYSRFSMMVTTKFGANDVRGYIEGDFNGNQGTNLFVTSNSNTSRMRLYWLDVKRGKWEFLGGQTWGLQTPNRIGVSPMPADLSLGYQEDAGVGVGYNYTRAGEFRVAYHFNDHFVWAVAAQNPDQFTNGEVTFPSAFNAQLGTQFDAANQTTTPNVGPDIITKFAWDANTGGGRNFHLELGGLETAVKATILPTVTGATFTSTADVGGGFFGGIVADLWKGSEGRAFRYVASGMWGYGVGRYLNGLAPQAVVFPTNASGTTCVITGTTAKAATGCSAAVSQVHAGDLVTGFEINPMPKTQWGFYYGGMYAQRDFATDITSTAATQPAIGFGGPDSAATNNRAVQEGTFDWVQTFWRNPQYGAIQLYLQGSYVTRAPWFVAAGAPKNAHLFMDYLSLRYVLP